MHATGSDSRRTTAELQDPYRQAACWCESAPVVVTQNDYHDINE